jgi:hypothetical protein
MTDAATSRVAAVAIDGSPVEVTIAVGRGQDGLCRGISGSVS